MNERTEPGQNQTGTELDERGLFIVSSYLRSTEAVENDRKGRGKEKEIEKMRENLNERERVLEFSSRTVEPPTILSRLKMRILLLPFSLSLSLE